MECLNYQLPSKYPAITMGQGSRGRVEDQSQRYACRIRGLDMLRSESDVTKKKSHDTRELRQFD